jgi:hypothetical protein
VNIKNKMIFAFNSFFIIVIKKPCL